MGYGLAVAFSVLFPQPGLPSSAILDSFTVTFQTLLTAYVIGFLLTLVTDQAPRNHAEALTHRPHNSVHRLQFLERIQQFGPLQP